VFLSREGGREPTAFFAEHRLGTNQSTNQPTNQSINQSVKSNRSGSKHSRASIATRCRRPTGYAGSSMAETNAEFPPGEDAPRRNRGSAVDCPLLVVGCADALAGLSDTGRQSSIGQKPRGSVHVFPCSFVSLSVCLLHDDSLTTRTKKGRRQKPRRIPTRCFVGNEMQHGGEQRHQSSRAKRGFVGVGRFRPCRAGRSKPTRTNE